MRWMLFVHIASVAFLLGGTAALYVLYRRSLRAASPEGMAVAYGTARSVVKGILNPSALLVLLTGIGMLLQVGMLGKTKPFWLAFMEQFGGMVALISAGLLTWQLRRLDRSATDEERKSQWRALNLMIAGVGVAVTLTILVVALRL